MMLRYPWVLLLLLLVPLLIYLRYAVRRRAALRFSDGQVLARLPVSWTIYAQYALPVLYGAGLISLIIALARPQAGLHESRVHAEAVDIVLLIDVSTSMIAEDFSIGDQRMNRLDAVKEVVRSFIPKRTSDRISLIAFAGAPYTVSPLTFDHAWLIQQVDRVRIGMVEDGTAIGSAIASALNRVRDSEAMSKVVVLLTDGVNNAGSITPENAADFARRLDVKVYTIGAGTKGFAPVPVTDPFGRTQYIRQPADLDEAQLRRIAESTGAQYFHADNYDALAGIYEEIDRLEKTEIEMEHFTRFEERFTPFLLLAISLLGLERLLAMTRLGRLP